MRKAYFALALFGLLALAQSEENMGLVEAGSYTPGSLGQIIQPLPAPAGEGSVYRVGAYPLYTPELADGPGKELVQGYCQVCHSTTYITMQPPLPAATWQAEVTKMINTYGAQIPEDTAKAITAYLQAHYTPETRK
ncbi:MULTISPECIES: sulfide dehydrogenase [unclassified Meiothermus]|uniref:sulfide dehydrogenase n=1 Tax=unclassified Meiothermus TaxID=370471 RepID=UPI000D7C2481|nr:MULTISPECIES: sulfide dehydrogenase [unclassified Meiothermus]PZA06334.1 sulfide dehydrogenase [Meiothermus sp. Pnk-1]RYM35207.1 sulfide dehydrogenase [Meiothermus sp. PNK-Is4]